MYKDTVKPALILTAICAVVSLLVAFTQFITADAILQQEIEIAEESKKAVLPYADSFAEIDAEKFSVTLSEGQEAYIGYNEEKEVVGYAIMTSTKGYGGQISVMTGFNIKGVVTGVEILSEEETEGLGKNANKESFRNQYVGKEVKKYEVVKIKVNDDNDILAITGATITTDAVTKAVNDAKAICTEILQ